MRGREDEGTGRRRSAAIFLSLALVLSLALAPVADAKKKKPKAKAVTNVSSIGISPGSPASATPNCPSKTQVTGGGWSITSPFNPNGTDSLVNDTGTRITHLNSRPNGLASWSSGAAAFNQPPNASTFSAVVRCESKSLGRVIQAASGSTTVPVGQGSTTDMVCPPKTHVLTGGFSFTPAGDLASPNSFRAQVTESRRLSANTWRIHIINPIGAPSPVTLATTYLCELNQKGVSVSEASAVATIAANERTSVTPTCTGKTHTIGGGFVASPPVGPAIGIDQMQPIGSKSWQVGLYEYPNFNLPAGSTITGYSYCKKNSLPKKKKKKK